MRSVHFKRFCLSVALLCGLYMTSLPAAVTGKILSEDTFAEADAASLRAEAELFRRVKDGVMLALAECEITEDCTPSVAVPEVERILETIDIRITALADRYSETNNPELEEALLVYADAREGYAEALEQLKALTGPEDEDDLGDDTFADDLENGDFSDLFEDADEDLQ